jgi:hypothetical protein
MGSNEKLSNGVSAASWLATARGAILRSGLRFNNA